MGPGLLGPTALSHRGPRAGRGAPPRAAGAPAPAAALNFGAQWGGGGGRGPTRPVGAHSNVPRNRWPGQRPSALLSFSKRPSPPRRPLPRALRAVSVPPAPPAARGGQRRPRARPAGAPPSARGVASAAPPAAPAGSLLSPREDWTVPSPRGPAGAKRSLCLPLCGFISPPPPFNNEKSEVQSG